MANSSQRLRIEEWLVRHALPDIYGQPFHKGPLRLEWGIGQFEVDGVSADGKIAVCISTASWRTATNRAASGKYHKIRSDALFLMHVSADTKVMAFTDPAMFSHFCSEQTRGRFPPADRLQVIELPMPPHLRRALEQSARIASSEVTPARATAESVDESQ